MTTQASFALRARNPDVLTCIANLSNDEVFTPPDFANRMLDTLAGAWAANNKGANIWSEKTVKFLDPCTKSGVFLREITRRLTKGLESEIPDLQKRVDHIYGGDFDFGLSSSERATNTSFAKINLASTDETDRTSSHQTVPEKRFHYRYQAADLAWEAAELMPDNSDETARMLCEAGSWLKYRDPKAADIFYKALVRRCRKTSIGEQANRMHWFPSLE